MGKKNKKSRQYDDDDLLGGPLLTSAAAASDVGGYDLVRRACATRARARARRPKNRSWIARAAVRRVWAI